MKTKDFRAFVAELGSLTPAQRIALMVVLKSKGSADDVVTVIEAEFAKAPACDHCGSQVLHLQRRRFRTAPTCNDRNTAAQRSASRSVPPPR